jgi:hypothetical protein
MFPDAFILAAVSKKTPQQYSNVMLHIVKSLTNWVYVSTDVVEPAILLTAQGLALKSKSSMKWMH